ncbi:hypothetical protein ACFOYW_07470 [Gryllotalpicola reticulitermitis]|uniref:Major facilitator superfamily (MFS) profile domain-containing protein n=1 Tax=Gryllotalpicola reticulitermitis TaxID=1184153 RepID=A0ABV8Q770_9MICO
MIKRVAFALAGLVLLAVVFGGGISLVVIVAQTAWGWLFLVVPALVIAAVILTRVGVRLLTRGLDG